MSCTGCQATQILATKALLIGGGFCGEAPASSQSLQQHVHRVCMLASTLAGQHILTVIMLTDDALYRAAALAVLSCMLTNVAQMRRTLERI